MHYRDSQYPVPPSYVYLWVSLMGLVHWGYRTPWNMVLRVIWGEVHLLFEMQHVYDMLDLDPLHVFKDAKNKHQESLLYKQYEWLLRLHSLRAKDPMTKSEWEQMSGFLSVTILYCAFYVCCPRVYPCMDFTCCLLRFDNLFRAICSMENSQSFEMHNISQIIMSPLQLGKVV